MSNNLTGSPFPKDSDDQFEAYSNTHVGKRALFVIPNYPDYYVFKFSSDINNIGSTFDRIIKNVTEVIIISDPEKLTTSLYGNIAVIKIFFQNDMWVPLGSIRIIEE